MSRASRRRVSSRPKLRQLAERLGIVSEYLDQKGKRIQTRDETREKLLAVMGFDAPTEDAAAGWLAELDFEERGSIIDAVRVVKRDARDANRVRVRLPSGAGACEARLTLTEESGHVWNVRADLRRAGSIELPTRAPYGYHTVTIELRSDTGAWSADQSLIVVPSSCLPPESILAKRRIVGIVANLYALRREQDWGVGDLGALMQLVEWSAARGVEFVGVNPLHSLFNRGTEISPYSPVSRLFRNHIYLDVDAVPNAPAIEIDAARRELAPLRDASHVDYDRVIAVKERALLAAYRGFRKGQDSAARVRDFEEFARQREPELTRYATWMTIAEGAGSTDWRRWPAELHDPESDTVRSIQRTNAERVDFHRWLQFETHRQLGEVAARAHTLGMSIGVYQDLAIGTNPGGSDTWTYPNLFLTGASVGAPPDPYSYTGQNWGLPPINPRALRQQRYRYWIELLRRAFEHAGALRIDHVMGLFRMFWIPEGGSGVDGAYVRFAADDLLGILALESVRHDAIVVGEDLGVVPANVPPAMKKWGILSSKVLYFERDTHGFRPASRYPSLALATANTHDMATLAGFWQGRDVELRERVGLISTTAQRRAEERGRVRDRQALAKLLRLRWPRDVEEPDFARTLVGAAHDFLCSTRARLVGLSLDDLVGEVDPVNVPGVGPDRYPSWRRRNRMTMEEIAWRGEVDQVVRCHSRRQRPL